MSIQTALPILSNHIDNELLQTVSLREVHSWLNVKTRFNDWVQRRIRDNEFMQDVDFVTILKTEYSPQRKEYHATLDMAKELCMLEQNSKGREARRYFIQCERIAKQTVSKDILAPQMRRYLDHKVTVPSHHFIALEIVTLELIAPLHDHGLDVFREMMPEASFVRSWNKDLRAIGEVIESFPTHQVQTYTGMWVQERCYPHRLHVPAHNYFWATWLPVKAPKYFITRQPPVLPAIPKAYPTLQDKLNDYCPRIANDTTVEQKSLF